MSAAAGAAVSARLAWWLARGQARRLVLLVACVAIAVAARVGVASFTGTVDRTLAAAARPMIGGDVEIAANRTLDAREEAELAAALPAASRVQHMLAFVTMAFAPASNRGAPVEIRAISPGWPMTGTVRVASTAAASGTSDMAALFTPAPGVYVQPELLLRLGVQVGGRLRLGTTEFTILGVIIEEPGMDANPFTLGPHVLVDMAKLPGSGLLAEGARIRHLTLVATSDPRQGEALATDLRRIWHLPEHQHSGFAGRIDSVKGIRVRTARQAQEGLMRFFDAIGDFLALVALFALLLGFMGVSTLVRGFLDEQRESMTTVRILGAGPRRLAAVVLLQMCAVSIAGGVAGLCLGGGLSGMLAAVLARVMALPAGNGWDAGAMISGMALAVLVGLGASALSLLRVARLRPVAWLAEGMTEEASSRAGFLALLIAAGVVGGLIWIQLGSWSLAAVVMAGVTAGGVMAQALAGLGLGLLGRVRPPSVGLAHGLANLRRGALRTRGTCASIAISTLVFAVLSIYQISLSSELGPATRTDLPSLFLLDIQDEQVAPLTDMLAREFGIRDALLAPLVRARYLGRRPAGQSARAPAASDEEEREREEREYNLSWRRALGPDEAIVAGKWMSPASPRIEASLERRFADHLHVGLGDVLTFAIQGQPVEATVTSLRDVRFTSMRPNFLILLSPKAFTGVTPAWVASLPELPGAQRIRVQARIAERFPTITAFDVSETGQRLNAVISQLADAVRLVGLACAAAGMLILIGLALSTARARRDEVALLKVLGARAPTILLSLGGEFSGIGVVAGFAGLLMSLPTGWVLLRELDIPIRLPWSYLAMHVVLVSVLCGVTGMAACVAALRVKPMQILRG